MGRLVENLWDCKYCETVGIGGSKRDCPNCGRPRDENIVFYLPAQKRYVPEAEAAKIDRAPNWVCNYCGALNPNGSKNCISCGNQRDEEDQNYFENRAEKEVKEREEREQIEYDSTSYADSGLPDEKRAVYDYFSGNQRRYSRKLPINFKAVGIVLVVLLLVAGLIYLLLPKEKDVTIMSMSWERSISIEEYRTVNESGWSVPVGGRIQYTRREISHYQQVLDHYETKTRQVARQRYVGSREVVVGYRDLGNGYSEEITSSVPEYETYYETETYQEPVYRSEPVYGYEVLLRNRALGVFKKCQYMRQ